MQTKGHFITFEGIEGVGKSTNMQFVVDWLKSHHKTVLSTREPGGTIVGEEIREILLRPRQDEIFSMTELLLLFAARAQHLAQVIKPSLEQGKWVVCDRFTDASFAYQGGGRQIPIEKINMLENLVQEQLRPDITILLDVPVDIGLARARGRGKGSDRIEREEKKFFERVRSAYLHRAEQYPERYLVVDASNSLEQVQQEISDNLAAMLELLPT